MNTNRWVLVSAMALAFFVGWCAAQMDASRGKTVSAAENRYEAIGWGDNNMDKLWVLDTNTGDVNYFWLANRDGGEPSRTFYFQKPK